MTTTLPNTPVMQQYAALKNAHAGFLLWFRMGDFYELLGDDAIAAAELLGIALTARKTAKEGDAGVPMCGVPHHAAEGYIAKCLQAGLKVALAEQTETPEQAKKARGSGALVRREVVRLYTPGTLTEDTLLQAGKPSYLAAVAGDDAHGAAWRGVLAWLELSTGEVGYKQVAAATLGGAVAALAPGEVVVPPALESPLLDMLPRKQVSVQESLFNPTRTTEALKRAYGLATVDGLGVECPIARTALGALMGYAELTQMGRMPTFKPPRFVSARSVLHMDAATRRNLELTEGLSGNRADGLLAELDKCITSAGSRLLNRWVAEPSADVAVIGARQQAVAWLHANTAARTNLRSCLKNTGDVARCVSRLLLGRGGPRDMAVLRQTGQQLPAMQTVLNGDLPSLLAQHRAGLNGLENLTNLLTRALADDPLPALLRDGGFIRAGFDAELDAKRALQTNGHTMLAELEATESAATGMALKARYNQVWGYYLEVTKAQLKDVPPHFVHRQTTTNAHRYTTPALMALERDLGSAGAAAQAREEALFDELGQHIRTSGYALLNVAEALATLDVLASLAEVAARKNWVCPVVDESHAFAIQGGRHPVVDARVGTFVPNDCDLSGGQLWLLTGPNMAGKSTFLRQNALLVVLAHMGSFVPAQSAHMGVADALMSRIGAADNLAAGQSTFMVEMVETAAILNKATPRSFVILDELGRGTATYDGLAIAWACVEHIAQNLTCRTLFATHYHELTTLPEQFANVSAHHVAVKEWKGEIVFLHKVQAGAATGSYGVHVAKLAGVPAPVVQRAAGLLEGFTKAAKGQGAVRVSDLALFTAPHPTPAPDNPIEQALRGLDVDALSARDALAKLYELRELASMKGTA